MARLGRKVIVASIGGGIVVLVVIGLLGCWFWDSYRCSVCAGNMAGIGQLISMYASQSNGQYPPDLDVLKAGWPQMGPAIFDCPLDQARGMHMSYEYIPGQSDRDSPRNVLLYEKPSGHRHEGGNVLYIDRYWEYVTPYSRVLELVEQTKARLAAEASSSMSSAGGRNDRE